MNVKKSIVFTIFILPYFMLIYSYFYYTNKISEIENSKIIIINKDDYSLKLYSYTGKLLNKFKVALGKNFGNKTLKGDSKTPEGVFNIQSIEDATDWEYDFENDTLGPLKGAYGPWFIRLYIPGSKGIGIHGTLNNKSLGTRDSHGCIRIDSDSLKILKSKISIHTAVVIVPSAYDLLVNKDTTDIIEEMYSNRLK